MACAAGALLVVTAMLPRRAPACEFPYSCTGDCLSLGAPRREDVQLCQQIAAGSAMLSQCPACDCNRDGTVSAAELAKAQHNFEEGCPGPFGDCPLPTCTATLGPDETPPPTSTPGPSTPTASPAPATATVTAVNTVPGATATHTAPAATATTPAGVETPTAGSTPAACVGDCDGSGKVAVNELVTGVGIALGTADLDRCPSFDRNNSLRVEVNELVAAVNNSLLGCR